LFGCLWWTPEHLPAGRAQAGDRHLKFHKTGDNLAIAAVHDEAESEQTTDWLQIVALYGLLLQLEDNPVVALNHAVAVSMVDGPHAGLERLVRLEGDDRINSDRRFHAVRAHLLEIAGDPEAALSAYSEAVRRATNTQQQRYLNRQITRLQSSL
jgi:predicted RNA polymerase sigma factor